MMCYFVQSNRLIKIENLDGLVNLEQLYLSHNGIEAIEGLDKLVSSLTVLIAVIILRIVTYVNNVQKTTNVFKFC